MTFSQRPEAFESADYLRALRRRWWIVAVLVIIGGAGAAAYYKTAPKVYTSTASVYVTADGASTSVAGGSTSGPVNMDSEAQVVQSGAVAAIAAHLLHTTVAPATLSKDVSVTVPPNSQVLQIICKQRGPKDAAAFRNNGEVSVAHRLLVLTGQHLWLVSISLAAAVLIIAGGSNRSFFFPALVVGVMLGMLMYVSIRDRRTS